MPVSLGQPPAKRCKQCEDSGQSRVENGPHSWSIQLDQDLLDTIIAIYPEWFKEYNPKRGAMSEGSGGVSNAPPHANASGSTSGTIAEVDDSPLQKTMDKNKESLKVKLMMRRPLNQLVAQGIIPSLKTPPAFHEQRQKLERAKTGDLLKAKIQQRPDREELVRQHILEADMGHVDPSLAERQRMLKKARLADSLNDQLSHRPGPLELIKKNILHTEEPIERAVKEGVIPFKATSEGQLRKPQHPDHYVTFEDDSQSSEGAASPSNTPTAFATNSLPTLDNIASTLTQAKTKETRTRDVLETAAASAGIVNVAVTIPTNAVVVASPILQQIPSDKSQTLQTFAELCSSVVSPLSLGSSTSSLSPLSSIASPPTPLTPRPAPMSSPAPGKADKNRKKSKTKTQPKTRTIKFHEYKGPPNAQKSTPVSASSTETSYELLLQQQQLFLQWQLEWQHKYPQIILPAAQKPSAENINTISSITNTSNNAGTTFFVTPSPRAATPVVQPTTPQSRPPSSPPQSSGETQSSVQTVTVSSNTTPSVSAVRVLTKLEDMKVSDLKMELKKRNLPVSGPKPQLIERLKSFTNTSSLAEVNGSGIATVLATSGKAISVTNGENPVVEMEIVTSPTNTGGNEEDEVQLSPGGKSVNCSPPPQSPLPVAMDTSEPSPPTSPNHGDNIIQQQQRKIEELQKELQKSQQQLQQIRQGKDSSSAVKTSSNQTITSTIPVKALIQNGIIHIDPKSQQKLILQQHLQNKIQQQQLQLQQQQQQQQQNSHTNETVNAKASLAAFINQQQAQHQLNSLIQAAAANNNVANSSNNNNNNNNNNSNNNNNNNNININNNNSNNNNNNNIIINNNNTSNNVSNGSGNDNDNNNNNSNNNNANNISNLNNNKNSGRKSIVSGQQQAAIVLNHLNLVKNKNGLLGHQRTNSLPSILSTIVQNAVSVDDKQQNGKMTVQKPKSQVQNTQTLNVTIRRASEEQISLSAKAQTPPQYEEATKKKGEISSETKTKNVKSQIVDDVLEILIKNGELPPSAANDPATPSTPGRSDSFDPEKGLLYPSAPPPPPPLVQPTFSVTLPKTINLTSQSPQPPPPQFNLPNTTFSSNSSFTLKTPSSSNSSTYTYIPQAERGNPQANQQTTNDITFSIGNSSFSDSENDDKSKNGFSLGMSSYLDNPELMSTETSDFNISSCNDQNFHSSSLDYILSSNANLLSSDLTSNDNILPSEYGNGDINLKELDLDLETLDSMDFSQLDCKMDGSDADMVSTSSNKTDQLINNNPELIKTELIEPMEMDDNWLDSLMPSSGNQSIGASNGSFEFLHCGDSPYDSILNSTQDPFGLFDIHDSDFKLSSSTLSWDKVDFAT